MCSTGKIRTEGLGAVISYYSKKNQQKAVLMKKSTTKLSRKIQLQIDLQKVEDRQAALRYLHHWQHCGFRAANMMISHLFAKQVLKGAYDSHNEDLALDSLENDFFPEVIKRFGEKIPLQMLEGIQSFITR